MPRKSTRRKRREAARRELQKLRAHPDCLDAARLKGYRRFCIFVRIWWVVCPLGLVSSLFAALMLESWTAIIVFLALLSTPLIVHVLRLECFEWKLTCPHCDRPGITRWQDRHSDERLRDIGRRRRYYRELKKAADTYICSYCNKKIRLLPHKEYKTIAGNRKNRE